MARNDHQTYVGKVVRLDDESYTNCRFENCTLVYSGGGLAEFGNNVLINSHFKFDGAAQRTVDFLRAAQYGGLAVFVDEVMQYIKG
jgi:hypothetical protein